MLNQTGAQAIQHNEGKIPKRLIAGWTIAIIIGYFLWLMIPRLQDNLWNDEIYTLKYFTFVPLHQTVTTYPVPNNHVFYNFCDNAYLKLIGVQHIKTAFEQPWMLRLPLLVLALLTLACAYKTACLIAGKKAGILAMTILTVTIGYQNFCLQIRGYAFSQFFILLLIFATLSYLVRPKKIYLALILLAAFASFYTVPSNIYPVLAVFLFLDAEIISQKLTDKKIEKDVVIASAFVAIGILVALVCYLPIIKYVTNNPYVGGEPPFDKIVFPQLLLLAIFQFVMDRHFAAFTVWSFLIFVLLAFTWRTTSRFALLMKILFFQVITPALLIFLQGQNPPDRSFAYAAPILAVCIAVIIVLVIKKVFACRFGYPEMSLLSLILISGSQMQLNNLRDTMDYNVAHGIRIQHLYRSYFSFNYRPLEVTNYLKQHSDNGQVPILLKDSEPYDLPEYFKAFQVPYYTGDSLDYLLKGKNVLFLISRYPLEVDSIFLKRPYLTSHEVMVPSYHHVFEIKRL